MVFIENPDQVDKLAGIFPQHILALSWDIATDPKLYWELAPNPYLPETLHLISQRFPDFNTFDVIRAVILAEPEGKYDRDFKLLGSLEHDVELRKQGYNSVVLNKRLVQYGKIHSKEFSKLPREFVYDSLSKIVFETTDLKEIQKRYSQNQRRDFKLSIITFIEESQETKFHHQLKHPDSKGQMIKAVSVFLFVLLLYYFANNLYHIKVEQRRLKANEQKLAVGEVQNERQSFPVRLKIPTINVNAGIQYVGVTPEGEMEVPSNAVDVGWFNLGPRPGEKGSAVIAGHVDSEKGENGVFSNLYKLKAGDKLYVEDSNGATTTFVFRENRIYSEGYAEEVFSLSEGVHLNLITCDGVWDGVKKSYSKRLVVFTDIMN